MEKVKMLVPENYSTKSIILSDLGVVETPSDEVIEVLEQHVKGLQNQNFKVVLEDKKGDEDKLDDKKSDEDSTNNLEDKKGDVDEDLTNKPENKIESIDYDKLKVEELIDVLEKSGLPKEEWGIFLKNPQKKKLLVKYIKNKLS